MSSCFIFQNSTLVVIVVPVVVHTRRQQSHIIIKFWKILSSKKWTNKLRYTLLYIYHFYRLNSIGRSSLCNLMFVSHWICFYHCVRSVCVFCHLQKRLGFFFCILLYFLPRCHQLYNWNEEKKKGISKNVSFVIVLNCRFFKSHFAAHSYLRWSSLFHSMIGDGKKKHIKILMRSTLEWLNFDFHRRLILSSITVWLIAWKSIIFFFFWN